MITKLAHLCVTLLIDTSFSTREFETAHATCKSIM